MTVRWDTRVEVLLDMLIEGCFVWEDGSLATGVNTCVTGDVCIRHVEEESLVVIMVPSGSTRSRLC